MLAILAPGQGAQRGGFLQPWLEVPGLEGQLGEASNACGIDLVRAGTTMSDTDIADTRITQPLVVAAALASARPLALGDVSAVRVGHSVGEFAALACAGAMSEETASSLVAVRAAAMAAAATWHPGAMVAVLGGDPAGVAAAVSLAGATIANHNAHDQVVAAGPVDAMAALAGRPPAGARLRQLAVAGAFHTELMATARDDLARAMDHATITSPRHIWVSNADGGVIGDAETIRRRLIDQICLPVRWDRCIDTLSRLGVTATIELAPGGVLTGLVRRALPHVQAVALRTPDDLDAATRVVREHGVEATASPMPWHVVVAPTRGLVRLPVQQVDDVCAGDLLGQVLTRTEDVPVLARQPGRLLEWLVSDGDPVSDGQPLARLAPVGCS